ncbi:cytochrome P450 [Abortiporus biennis]|nr:cytochrome P450 [Abortiporus biennis]
MSLLLVVQSVSIWMLSWAAWVSLRRYFIKSPLDNVPGPASTSFAFGHLKEIDDPRDGWAFQEQLATQWNGVVKFKGMFNKNMLFVFDPQAIHNILLKDQYVYENASFRRGYGKFLLGDGLLAVVGSKHRAQRKMMNPVFSIAHMRGLFPTFTNISYKLRDALRNQVKDGRKEIDILGWIGRTALELIGQGGLGYSFDLLVEDVPNELGEAIKKLMPSIGGMLRFSEGLSLLDRLGQTSAGVKQILRWIPFQKVQNTLKLVNTLHDECERIYYEKKTALLTGKNDIQPVGDGHDIMTVLLKANLDADEQDRLPDNQVIGQMSTLVFAAVDTTSSALTRTFELLAKNQDVQDNLRAEIVKAREGWNDLTYDQVVELPLLDAVCRETLRMYSPAGMIFKAAAEDTVMPLSKPMVGVDGTLMTEIPVPKGTQVYIGVHASNRNPELWGEDANEWKPERWLSPLPKALVDARLAGVYAHLMTFSGGGRSCIGFKFSQLEMSTAFYLLKFTLSENHHKVFWNATRVSSPSIGPGGKKPSMPMNIELVST